MQKSFRNGVRVKKENEIMNENINHWICHDRSEDWSDEVVVKRRGGNVRAL